MLEIDKTLTDLANHLQDSRKGYLSGYENFRAAEKDYRRIEQIRLGLLQGILKDKGLVVCSGHHHYTRFSDSEEWKNKSAKELGIFPKEEMKLRYVQGFISEHDHFTDTYGEIPFQEILLLCPEHFAQRYLDVHGNRRLKMIYDEVIQKDEKTFILADDGWDLSHVINQTSSFRSRVELEGSPNPDISVYRYFGIPDLPPQPDLSMVR